MNGKKTKRIRKQVKHILVDWLHSLLSEEEALKINSDNVMDHLPKQTHYMSKKTIHLNSFHPKWVANKIKNLVKNGRTIEDIRLNDIK